MAGNTCDCCNKEGPTQVVSSAVGPASFAYCDECIRRNAEPLGCFYYLYDDVSNKGEGLVNDVKLLTTYKDGKYITWDEFVTMRRAE
jgi:hypothetical protein